MRFILFFLFVTLAFSSDYLNTQALNKNIIENINPPTGYKPFFINLLSRHSARYLSSENKIKNALKILDKYNIYLTSNGIKLRKKLLKIKAFEDGKYGKISKIGKTLAIKIGDEFYKKFKNVFVDDKTILVYYTSIIRTKQSADYFLKDFKNVKIIESKNDEILRFFKNNKTYVNFMKNKPCKEFLAKNYDFDIFSKIAKKFINKNLSNDEALKLINNLYGIYTNKISSGYEVEFNFFNDKELKILSEYKTLKDYCTKSGFYDINYKIAKPLLRDFLQTSNKAILDNNLSGVFRFAHAETLIPFLTLLNHNLIFKNKNDILKNFNESKMFPMLSNLAWIFYKNDKNEVIILQLLNQKIYKFPFKCKMGEFCTFEEVKSYYDKVLKY